MPKTQMDYSKCCIYKIEHIDDENLVYVGHTTNFDKRKNSHKSICNNEKNVYYNSKLYLMMRNNGGWDDFKMFEVEKYPCKDRREAERRENEVMKELKANMNTIKSFRAKDEKQEYNREYMKVYNKINKLNLLEEKKVYYSENKENLKEQMKIYNKKHYEKNKEKHKEKITCECGCEITKLYLKKHQTSKKHIELINQIQ